MRYPVESIVQRTAVNRRATHTPPFAAYASVHHAPPLAPSPTLTASIQVVAVLHSLCTDSCSILVVPSLHIPLGPISVYASLCLSRCASRVRVLPVRDPSMHTST